MPWFSNSHSWTNHAREMTPPRRKGSWTRAANATAKENKETREETEKRRKQIERSLRGRRLNPFLPTPNLTAVQKGANKKIIARSDKRRAKRAAKKAARRRR